ncbi:MAG: AMP-binding protein [Bdellovibrionales bacterium]|nr:AMP-binding protein [Ramlibacter sp.]
MTAPIDRIDRLFAHNARTLPGQTHLVLADCSTQTWLQTWQRASAIASALLGSGVKPGDRVLVLSGNSRELQELYVACGIANAICVPVNTLTTARELVATAQDCSPAAAFLEHALIDRISPELSIPGLKVVMRASQAGWQTYEDVVAAAPGEQAARWLLQPPVDSRGDDPGVMIYSSGTTGKPKGILLSQYGVIENARMTQSVARLQMSDINLAMLPLFSSFGFCWDFLMPALAGATTVILTKFDPQSALKAVEKHRVTVLVGVPTMFARIFDAPELSKTDISTLRLMDVGGGPVSDKLKHDLKHVHGIEIIESFGLTEISPVAAAQVPGDAHRAGSTGPALPGVQVKVIDFDGKVLPPNEPGELCFSAPTLMLGYWNRPEQTAESLRNGWLHSGDIGIVDEDGHIYIRDRLKDMIVANGYNVYPKEVENALAEHPVVQNVAVVGVPDEIRGEVIHAFVVLREGASATGEALIAHCATLIGKHKLPRQIHFTDNLPLTASGKIQRFALRDQARANIAAKAPA